VALKMINFYCGGDLKKSFDFKLENIAIKEVVFFETNQPILEYLP